MNEKKINKISLIMVILGLIFLFFMSSEIDIKSIESLEPYSNKETVQITGEIIKLHQTPKATFIEIQGQETTSMDIIFFPEEETMIKEGDFVQIQGEIETYQGKKEVIANSVILK